MTWTDDKSNRIARATAVGCDTSAVSGSGAYASDDVPPLVTIGTVNG
jgi:hypothetical protein